MNPSMRGGLTEGAAARGKRTREELDALGKELPAAQLLRATAGCGAIGGAPILLGLGDGGALGARAAAASAGVSMPAGISLPASLSGLFDFALPPMLSPSRAAGSGADALHAGQQQVPPGGQGVVGALAPPPASDQNVYSKWAMMLQQQLESAYLERSRILQLAIKLQLENLHLKEALFSENAQRFLQLVQLGTIAAGPLIDGCGMEVEPPLARTAQPQQQLGAGASADGSAAAQLPRAGGGALGGTGAGAGGLGAPGWADASAGAQPPQQQQQAQQQQALLGAQLLGGGTALPSLGGRGDAAGRGGDGRRGGGSDALRDAAGGASASAGGLGSADLFGSLQGADGSADDDVLTAENLSILAQWFDQSESGGAGQLLPAALSATGALGSCRTTQLSEAAGGARDLVPDGKPVTIDSKQPSAFDFEFF